MNQFYHNRLKFSIDENSLSSNDSINSKANYYLMDRSKVWYLIDAKIYALC